MADTPLFPTAESVQSNVPRPAAPGATAPAVNPAQARDDSHRWDAEGGSNALHQPSAAVEPLFAEQALAFVSERPLLSAGIAGALGALAVAALSFNSTPAPGSRRALRRRRALLEEVHQTTQAILRAVGHRVDS